MTNISEINQSLAAVTERLSDATPTIEALQELQIKDRARYMARIADEVEELDGRLPVTRLICMTDGWSIAAAADSAEQMLHEATQGSAQEEKVAAALADIVTMREQGDQAYAALQTADDKEVEIAEAIKVVVERIGEYGVILAQAETAADNTQAAQQAAIGHVREIRFE